MEQNLDTEKQILQAAKEVFLKKGFDGARMQEIADLAGINKAMLHYYYRSKDKLFDNVFLEITSELFPKLFASITSDLSIEEKIKLVINNYIDFLMKNPEIPLFMLREINSNPQKISHILKEILKVDIIKENLKNNINSSLKESNLNGIDPAQIILTVLGSCIFPAMAKNLIVMLFDMNENDFNTFMENRKTQLPDLLINGIRR